MSVINLDLSPEREAELREEAQALGLSVEEHIVKMLKEHLADLERVRGQQDTQKTVQP